MWLKIIEELKSIHCVGPGLPIACHRHPDSVEYVSEPRKLPQIAPDGMHQPRYFFSHLIQLQVDVCDLVKPD